ncbi:MAG: substrate-binding domain-containing protein [Spirochaetes bacterium]|nr:substrate-binding domain-containing protein [Spirochaetota bacterium]
MNAERTRKRLLFIAGRVDRGYMLTIFKGISAAAREREADIFTFVPHDGIVTCNWNAYAPVIDRSHFDGVLILATTLTMRIGKEKVQQGIVSHYRQLPIVSISAKLNDVPAVLADSKTGVINSIEHLIQVHKKKRILCLKGPANNDEAAIRLEAYKEALARNKIPFDPALVIDGGFSAYVTKKSMLTFCDNKKNPFDAIVAGNDGSALGASEFLSTRRSHPGRNYALVGFDDSEDARFHHVPLSTVRMPMIEMGRAAVDLLFTQMEGGSTAGDVILPAEFVIRKSCGCFDTIRMKKVTGSSVRETTAWKRATLAAALEALPRSGLTLTTLSAGLEGALTVLVGGFKTAGEEKIFLETMYALLSAEVRAGGDITTWYAGLSSLAESVANGPFTDRARGVAERLIAQVNSYIAEKLTVHQAVSAAALRADVTTIRFLSRALQDNKFNEHFTNALATLGITRCAIARFAAPITDTLPEHATLMVRWDKTSGTAEFEQKKITAHSFIDALPNASRHDTAVFPLGDTDGWFGIIALSMVTREHLLYDLINDAVTAVLRRLCRAV